MMKLIHCADLHLDSVMNTHLPKEKARERRSELLHNFTRLADWAAEHAVRGILIAGDLFDKNAVSAAAAGIAAGAMEAHPEIAFYYLRGNHDADGFLSRLPELPQNLRLFGETWTSYEAAPGSRVLITGAENGQALSDTLRLPEGSINLVLMHGQASEYGGKDPDAIDLRSLRGRNIDYLALGHVHEHREGRLDARGIWAYPGCLEGRGFDECGEHGFLLLDIDEAAGSVRTEFVPFAGRAVVLVRADVSGCRKAAEFAAALDRSLREAAPGPGALVRAEPCGEVPADAEKDLSILEKQHGQEFYVFQVKDCTGLQVDYAAYAFDESLKGEFVRRVQKEDLSEEDRAAVVRAGLRALSGEALL